jgi:hypothetical protein
MVGLVYSSVASRIPKAFTPLNRADGLTGGFG